MRNVSALLRRELFGNSYQDYLSAAVTFLLVLAALFLVRTLLLKRLQAIASRTATDLDDFAIDLLGRIRAPEYHLLAFYIASRSLALSGSFNHVLHIVIVAVLSVRVVLLLQHALAYALRKMTEKSSVEDLAMSAVVKNVRLLLNAVLWVLAAIFILDNLGVNITAAMAGLGVGGIAVALAAQQLLGDLFSSFVIYTDKPFSIGDAISVGDMTGTVEHVGIKTTRLRSATGELLVFPNSDLTSSRIRNFKRMEERRVTLSLGLVYQTPYEKVKAVPGMIREILFSVEHARLDRAHFKAFGPSSLDFEISYAVLSADYVVYMDTQQRINLKILERFQKEGIEFAYPSQTVFLAK